MRSALVAFVLAVSASAHATPPCVGPQADFAVPGIGAIDVPTNVTPVVANASELPRIVGDDDVDVAMNVETMAIVHDGGLDGEVLRLLPLAPLDAGRSYRVVVGARDITSFTTNDVVDDEPPLAPNATMPQRYYDNCGATQLEIVDGERERTDAALFIVADATPSMEDGAAWMGASPFEDNVIVYGAVHGTTLQVSGVDLAGNVSVPTPVEVRLPPASCVGCLTVDGAPMVFALALLALRCRRR